MASVYYNLIVKGRKTIGDVPDTLIDAVKALLIQNGYTELAEEAE